MRKLKPDEPILLDGFHEYQLIDGELYETTNEYVEVSPSGEIRVELNRN